MPRSAETTRRRILEAAYELFYRKGYNRVGIEEVATAASVTKRTLYQHFASKDDLLQLVLEMHHELALQRIRKYDHRYDGNAQDIVAMLFSALASWSTKKDWTGAGFTRLAMELADLPGHPARNVARRHKKAVEAWYVELMARAKVPAAAERARELALLVEGAAALILIHGDRSYADTAARAAERLIRAN